jgi:hypothetical protein
MAIKFTLDLDKTIAAMAVFANGREGASLDMFLSLKRLYLADRRALISWGNTITGDKMISMAKGPLLSAVYDLFKGKGSAENLRKWRSYFGETSDNMVRLRRSVNLDILSAREIEALRAAQEEIGSVPPNELPAILHQRYPEWEDVGGGSKTIDPATILRKIGRSEDEIRRVEEEAESFNDDAKMFRSLAGKMT